MNFQRLVAVISSCFLVACAALLPHTFGASTGTGATTGATEVTSGDIGDEVTQEESTEAGATTYANDDEFVSAVDWMYSNDLTRYSSIDDFRPGDVLTRQEAAKFFSQFSTNVLYEVIDMAKYCEFDDLDQADPTLKNAILQSCLLNLFHGSRGNFFPHQQLTKAQALAVLIRALEGNQPEDIDPRWYYYHARAKELGLTNEQDVGALDRPVTRYEISLLLYRAAFEVADEEKN